MMKRFLTIFLSFLLLFTTVFIVNNSIYAEEEETETVSEVTEKEESDEELPVQEIREETSQDEEDPPAETELPTQEEESAQETEEELPEALPEADEIESDRVTTGTAYAVLDSEGNLIFFRSTETYTAGSGQTVSDIKGNEYTGEVFTSFEKRNDYVTLFKGDNRIKTIRVADGQLIKPYHTIAWFEDCDELVNADLRGFDMSYIGDLTAFFKNCTNLVSVNLDVEGAGSLLDLREMFSNCMSLKDVVFFSTTRAVKNFNSMFQDCSALEEIDLSNLDTGNAKTMTAMFSYSWSIRKVTLGKNMTKWLDNAYLPNGRWVNEAKGLSKTHDELYNYYPENAEAWSGEWVRDDEGVAYAILQDSNKYLVFTRSFYEYENGTHGTLVDRNDFVYEGIIYANVENTGNENTPPWWNERESIKAVYAADTIRPKSMHKWFSGASNMENFGALNFDTSEVTNMFYLFDGCSSLKQIEDLDHFDTSNVTDMYGMFYTCKSLTSLDLSSFDTSKVNYKLDYMFRDCKNLTELDLSSFDTSNVISMYNMFSGCSNLKTLVLGENFKTGNVTKMEGMFFGCEKLKSLDLSSFDTSKVENMQAMFDNCFSLTSVKLGTKFTTWRDKARLPSGNWFNTRINISKTDLELYNEYPGYAPYWYGEWKRLTIYAILTSDGTLYFTRSDEVWNNGASGTLTDRNGNKFTGTIFCGIESTPSAYDSMPWESYKNNIKKVLAVDTIAPKNMYNWFYECSNLEYFDSTNFDTSKTEYLVQVFCGCRNLTYVDLSHFDTSNVKSMAGMFRSCENLTSIDLSNFNTKNVWSMEQLFYMCNKLEDLDISSFDTSNVERMATMFSRCRSLKELDLSHFDTSKTESMYDMFESCVSLHTLDLSSFDTSKVENMTNMFYECSALTSIKLGDKFTRWINNAMLPAANWKNESKGLMKTADELYSGYPDHAAAWSGEWTRDLAYAILKDNGDLVFTRSKHYYPNGEVSTLTDLKGNTITGTVYGNVEDTGYSIPGWTGTSVKRVYALDTIRPLSMNQWFFICHELESFDATNFDTSACTNMHFMFGYCSKLEELDLSTFDTSKVEDMSCMFADMTSIKSLDLRSFDTSSVTNLGWMFDWDENLESIDLSSFDTSKVTDMTCMFRGCDNLTSLKLGKGFTNWLADSDLAEAEWTNEAKNLVKTTDELISGYPANASKWAGEWTRSFAYAVLTDEGDLIFTRSRHNYEEEAIDTLIDTKGNSITGRIFKDFEDSGNMPWQSYRSDIVRVYALDTIKPITMQNWFNYCYNLKSFDGSNFDTSKVMYMSNLFYDCQQLESADVSGFDTSSVLEMYDMFGDCIKLRNIDVSGFNTDSVTSMDYMFYNCNKLESLDLSNFNTENVVNMNFMFYRCESLETLDLSSFHTPNLISTYYMFSGCASLKTLDLSNFSTANVTSMTYMFNNCGSLKEVRLGPDWVRWDSGSELPSGTWTNGIQYLANTVLRYRYTEDPLHMAGTWTKTDKSSYGDILPEDRAYFDTYSPSGIWISQIEAVQYEQGVKKYEPAFRVYDYMTLLSEGTDYTFRFTNNSKSGTAKLTVTGKGNYIGTYVKEFEIKPISLNASNTTVTIDRNAFVYNGKVKKPSVTSVVYNGKKLDAKTDYKVVYDADSKGQEGTDVYYYVSIEGKGNYGGLVFGKEEEKYLISPKKPVSSLTISGFRTSMPYDPLFPCLQDGLLIKDKSRTDLAPSYELTEGDDYDLIYEHNDEVGTATMTIVGRAPYYSGTLTKTFKITGKALSKVKITGVEASYDYTGAPITPAPILTDGTYTLVSDSDYKVVEYQNNIQIGTATIVIEGRGAYTGTVNKTFKIKGFTLSSKTVELDDYFNSSVTYTGEEIRQDAAGLIDKSTHTYMGEGVDYTVSYKNNINAGTATVTYTGINAYTGTYSKTYKITKAKIAKEDVELAESYPYVKGGAKPVPVIKVGSRTLVSGKDFTLAYANNTKAGKIATVTITGKGNYSGTVKESFTVTTHYLSGLTMTAADKIVATKPAAMSTTITLTDSNGKKLVSGTDYEKTIVYTYAESGDPVPKEIIPVGTLIKATVTLKGNYAGKISKTFRIVSASIAKATVTIPVQYYTGSTVYLNKSDIKMKVGTKVLTENDFDIVSYTGNTYRGTATVTLQGKGEYGGTKTVKFTISQRSLGITVKFNGNGATSGSMKNQRIYENTKLTENAFKNTGHKFLGWSTNPYAAAEDFKNADKIYSYFRPGDVITLYAIWS